jgi:hypothetical protein
MKKNDLPIFVSAFAVLCLFIVGRSLPAAPLRAALRQATIAVGEKAVVSGQAAAGSRIAVQITGPASLPPGNATADAAGNYSLELGPFNAPGSYGLYVRAGIEQQLLVLEVQERMAAGALREAANRYTQALNRLTTAEERKLEKLAGLVGQFPPGDPDMSRVAGELPRLRTLFFDVHRVVDGVVGLTEPLVFDLCEVQGLQAGACTEMSRIYDDDARSMNTQADSLENDSLDEEARNASDWCLRAAYVKMGFSALAAVLKIKVGGLSHYILETLAAGRGAGALGWFQERFMEHMPNALRSLTETQEHRVHLAHTGIEAVMPYVLEGEHAHPWATLISIGEGTISGQIDGYLEHHCQTFRGRISGHVHIEVAEEPNARPFYGLDNDWTGQVTLSGSRPESNAAVPVSGSIIGRAKNFKASNWLYVLYGRDISQKAFTTDPPSIISQAGALFYASLEGSIHAGVLTIKHVKTTLDGVQWIKARLTATVIPSGSPVPVVKSYDVPFQNADFQLSRCFGKEGVSFPIEMEVEGNDTRRRVKGTFSRDLTKGGARGTFTIKVDLCSGCPATWEGKE